jgi:hypothetical protein
LRRLGASPSGPGRLGRRLATIVAAAAIGLLACTSHPVGPARTFTKFEGKAVTTAEAALSSVETVRLAATTASDDHGFGPYLSVLISDQEEGLSGVQGTFDSIQPPDRASDDLRDELDQLLSNALDHVVDVRIAVRRGELADLGTTATPLADDADLLTHFIDEHRS